ncbi:unnamed protein product [Trichobilharzia szidati]|nr:unnamed protein product [Trichobilharzia szidati]
MVVLRINRLPKYFGPAELHKYLEQFGKVYDLYIPKSKKTNRYKDHAFVRMANDVAPFVASTLDNLLQFNKIMKCEILSDNKRLFRAKNYARIPPHLAAEEQQTLATIKRVAALRTREELNVPKGSAKKPLPLAIRRRTRNLQKRLAAIKNVNPNFEFQSANSC